MKQENGVSIFQFSQERTRRITHTTRARNFNNLTKTFHNSLSSYADHKRLGMHCSKNKNICRIPAVSTGLCAEKDAKILCTQCLMTQWHCTQCFMIKKHRIKSSKFLWYTKVFQGVCLICRVLPCSMCSTFFCGVPWCYTFFYGVLLGLTIIGGDLQCSRIFGVLLCSMAYYCVLLCLMVFGGVLLRTTVFYGALRGSRVPYVTRCLLHCAVCSIMFSVFCCSETACNALVGAQIGLKYCVEFFDVSDFTSVAHSVTIAQCDLLSKVWLPAAVVFAAISGTEMSNPSWIHERCYTFRQNLGWKCSGASFISRPISTVHKYDLREIESMYEPNPKDSKKGSYWWWPGWCHL